MSYGRRRTGGIEQEHAALGGRLWACTHAERLHHRVHLRMRAAIARRIGRRHAPWQRLAREAAGAERVGALRAATRRDSEEEELKLAERARALLVGLDEPALRQRPLLTRVRVAQFGGGAAALVQLQVAASLATARHLPCLIGLLACPTSKALVEE